MDFVSCLLTLSPECILFMKSRLLVSFFTHSFSSFSARLDSFFDRKCLSCDSYSFSCCLILFSSDLLLIIVFLRLQSLNWLHERLEKLLVYLSTFDCNDNYNDVICFHCVSFLERKYPYFQPKMLTKVCNHSNRQVEVASVISERFLFLTNYFEDKISWNWRRYLLSNVFLYF